MIQFSIADQIGMNARSFPDRVAIEVLDGPTLTYADAWRRVSSLADGIGEVPPGPHGPVVAFLLPNGVDHVLAYVVCQALGVAGVPINSRLAQPEIEFVLKDSGATVLLTGGEFTSVARAAAEAVGATVVCAEDVATAPEATRSVEHFTDRGDDIAFIVYTSGTTGFPKGAIVSHDALFIQFLRYGWQFRLTPATVMLVGGPLFHLSFAGLSLTALMGGARIRVMPSFDGDRACEEFQRSATWAFMVPSMTTMVIEAWKRRGSPAMPSLQFLLSSGASVPSALLEEAMEAFPNATIAEAYGWTEGGWCTMETKDLSTLRPHSVGWPVVGYDVVIRDDDGVPCPVGQAGEITSRGIVRFAGYLNRPEANEIITREGFVRSGDIGILDEDGRIRVVDRKNDMIVSGGENIYSAEVERVLLDHPRVAEAAVVARPDPRWGEAVVAVVVPAGDGLDGEEVRAFCREHMAGYKVPKEVLIFESLPRNPMGKVQKFRLREMV